MASKLLLCMTLASLSLTSSAMYFVSRDEWNALPPTEAYKDIGNPLGVKVHYLGPSFAGTSHSECDDFMLSIQKEHMSNTAEGWIDIAYNMAVCQHGYVYDGRGAHHMSGANGDVTLNQNHYAVLGFLGKVGVDEPSDSMIIGIQDSIAYLRRAGAGDEIKGHKDGYSTECPGPALYALVQNGTLDPGKLWDGGDHIVKEGETLDDLEAKYGVPKRYIIYVNGLEEPYELEACTVLEIPARGVPLASNPPCDDCDDGGDGEDYVPFPGDDFFRSEPDDPIIEAMGTRLVEEECDKYTDGPSTQWTDEDLASYQCWQEKLGYTGADADGWPGPTSWDLLKVRLSPNKTHTTSEASATLTPGLGSQCLNSPTSSVVASVSGTLLSSSTSACAQSTPTPSTSVASWVSPGFRKGLAIYFLLLPGAW